MCSELFKVRLQAMQHIMTTVPYENENASMEAEKKHAEVKRRPCSPAVQRQA